MQTIGLELEHLNPPIGVYSWIGTVVMQKYVGIGMQLTSHITKKHTDYQKASVQPQAAAWRANLLQNLWGLVQVWASRLGGC